MNPDYQCDKCKGPLRGFTTYMRGAQKFCCDECRAAYKLQKMTNDDNMKANCTHYPDCVLSIALNIAGHNVLMCTACSDTVKANLLYCNCCDEYYSNCGYGSIDLPEGLMHLADVFNKESDEGDDA